MKTYGFVAVGGGVVWVSTAWQLQKKYPGATIALLEKETSLARHQTGRNSIIAHRLSQVEFKKKEPHIQLKAALLIPATGITDYAQVT